MGPLSSLCGRITEDGLVTELTFPNSNVTGCTRLSRPQIPEQRAIHFLVTWRLVARTLGQGLL